MALPDYLTSGQPVVLMTGRHVYPVEVIRTTATQVIINDQDGRERRFRAAYGRVVEVGADHYRSDQLRSADDPAVLGIKRERVIDGARGAIRVAADARPLYGHGDLTALIVAIAHVREVADEQLRALRALTADEN